MAHRRGANPTHQVPPTTIWTYWFFGLRQTELSCNGPRTLQRSGKLLIKPSEWAGSASAPRSDGQILRKAPRDRGGQPIHEPHPDGNVD